MGKNKAKKFQCQRCGECCKQKGYVYLDGGEVDRTADFLKMDIYDFTEQFCEVVDRRRLILKRNRNDACIFLKADECMINPIKPNQCSDFPFEWKTEKSLIYCRGLRR